MCSSQSLPRNWSGEPVSRGPIESSSACASVSVCDCSMPSVQIRRSTGSSVAKVCA
jgi:hypothetical protein